MRPKVDQDHEVIEDYYDFSKIDIENIRDRIEIIDCENVGVSYGQFVTCLYQNMLKNEIYDYYMFLEDDYVASIHDFDTLMIDEFKYWNLINVGRFNNPSMFLCTGIAKHENYTVRRLWYNYKRIVCLDFSLGIMNYHAVNNLFDMYPYDAIMDSFRTFKGSKKYGSNLHINQIFFSYLINNSNIVVRDICAKYLSVFYETDIDGGILVNYPETYWKLQDIITRPMRTLKFDAPLFMPLQFFFPQPRDNVINLCREQIKNQALFKEMIKNISQSIDQALKSIVT